MNIRKKLAQFIFGPIVSIEDLLKPMSEVQTKAPIVKVPVYQVDSSIGIDGLPIKKRFNASDLTSLMNNDEELRTIVAGMPTQKIIEDNKVPFDIKAKTKTETKEIEREIHVEDNRKLIALSINEAPSIYTDTLMDLLKQTNSHATFFVYGARTLEYKDVLERMQNEKHEIAIHSYNEGIPFPELDIAEVESQVTATKGVLSTIGISSSNLVRPPKGIIYRSITERLAAPIQVGDIDVTNKDNAFEINEIILQNVKNGSVIMVDGNKKETLRAIRTLIPELISRDYKLVTIGELYKARAITQKNGKVYAHAYPINKKAA